jgi:hypothetical protein
MVYDLFFYESPLGMLQEKILNFRSFESRYS